LSRLLCLISPKHVLSLHFLNGIMIKSFLRTFQFINKHPLASKNRSLAISNWVRWQISSSILKMPVIFPWIGQSKLVAERGMTGATGNIYAGLHEFTDMAFCLHLLRSGDLFVDVGANIGSYTVLASKAIGTNSVTLEPVPQTFERLQQILILMILVIWLMLVVALLGQLMVQLSFPVIAIRLIKWLTINIMEHGLKFLFYL